MNSKECSINALKPHKPPRRRIYFFAVAALFVIALPLCCCFFYAPELSKFVVERAIKVVSSRSSVKIDLSGFGGTLLNGFSFENLTVQNAGGFKLIAEQGALSLDYLAVLKGKIELSCAMKALTISGSKPLPAAAQKLKTLIEVPAGSCFLGVSNNFSICRLDIDNIKYTPWRDFLGFAINVKNLSLMPSLEEGKSDFSAKLNVKAGEATLANGALKGIACVREKKFDGQAEINILDQKIVSEISFKNKKNINEISGCIASTGIDLTPIASKLAFLWQENVPIGISGGITISGAWLYNEKTGFLGNLSGKINKLKLNVPGLFLTLLEVNGSWKYFDDTLQITDNGTAFMGISAKLNGKIENLSSKKRMSFLDLNCEKIDIESLLNSLPWAVKYSLALPQVCKGNASLCVKARSAEPMFFCRLSIDKAVITEASAERTLEGRICAESPSFKKWHFDSALKCDYNALPPFLSSFKGDLGFFGDYCRENLSKHTFGGSFSYRLSGASLSSLKLSGSLTAGGISGEASGAWAGNLGNIGIKTSKGAVFNKSGVSLIDLLLFKQ